MLYAWKVGMRNYCFYHIFKKTAYPYTKAVIHNSLEGLTQTFIHTPL